MIKKPQNWENVQTFTDVKKLPVGAYECIVKKVEIGQTRIGQVLRMYFDITAGEYAGYYEQQYKANQNADKKWRGILAQWLPNDNGSENDERTKSSLKGCTTAFERSNPGYKWNWDEQSLVGKKVGILMRNEEWEYNGKTGWTVKPFRPISISTVQDGSYRIPDDKPLRGDAYEPQQAAFVQVEDDELPF